MANTEGQGARIPVVVPPAADEVAADGPSPADHAQGFLDKAMAGLADLVEVQVVTLVGGATVRLVPHGKATETDVTVPDDAGDHKAIVTIVKLLDGDITTIVHPDLLSNTELRATHAAQVATSLEVLPRNIRALVNIARALLDRPPLAE